jgi:hypothetical protein
MVANAEMMKCDLRLDLETEKILEMAKTLIIEPDALLSEGKEPCLLQAAKYISESDLIDGYQLTVDDIRGILFHSHMLDLIFKYVDAETEPKPALNFYNDLADAAGHHVLMYAEDALSQGYLEYFNEKLPEFFEHQITSSELRLLYYYYIFASELIEWREEGNQKNQPHLKSVK